MGNNGIFGEAQVVNEPTPDEQAIADYFLGYTDTPPDVAGEQSEPANDASADEPQAKTDEGAADQPADKKAADDQVKPPESQQAAPTVQQGEQDPAATWQMEKQQYEQALQYMAALLQQFGALSPFP